jgi:phosphoadenosine phosphosulfate reductase
MPQDEPDLYYGEHMKEQQLLPTFSPTESDMIESLLGRSLEKKIEHSINLIKCWSESANIKDPENGFQFGDSGGKDSCVTMRLLEMAGVKFKATYNVTTIDPPELVRFIRKHHPKTEWNRGGTGHLILDRMVEKMSMPTRIGKWCCSEYKDCCSSSNTIGVVGVRIAESARRAGMWKEFTKHTKTGRWILAPICYWTDDDVWNFIRQENIPYCELYDQGWSRLGCVGCPINPKSQKKEFERWPKYEAMWRKGARIIWERSQTEKNTRGEWRYWKKFESPDEMFQWWLTGKLPQRLIDERQKQRSLGLENDENFEDSADIGLEGGLEDVNCVFEEMMENT